MSGRQHGRIEREGYQSDFLGEGFEIALPIPGLELEADVLVLPNTEDETLVDYIHYTLMMNRRTRQAMFSAANVDNNNQHTVSGKKGRNWFVDARVGEQNQITNTAYKNNDWDRGHLTRRTAVTWGESQYMAKNASNDSCSYANACLQHMNFNQDEWRVPEKLVSGDELPDITIAKEQRPKARDEKFSVMTGPVFTTFDRHWHVRGYPSVRIPGGFWKVIAYVEKGSDKLRCQAYVMYQDREALRAQNQASGLELKNYQVTITELEQLTGLIFDRKLYEQNPLRFFDNDEDNNDTTNGHERILVPRAGSTPATPLAITREDVVNIRANETERYATVAPENAHWK